MENIISGQQDLEGNKQTTQKREKTELTKTQLVKF